MGLNGWIGLEAKGVDGAYVFWAKDIIGLRINDGLCMDPICIVLRLIFFNKDQCCTNLKIRDQF